MPGRNGLEFPRSSLPRRRILEETYAYLRVSESPAFRWFQYRMRMLLLLALMVSRVGSWFAVRMRKAIKRASQQILFYEYKRGGGGVDLRFFRHNRANECRKVAKWPRHLSIEFHIIHLPCKCLENAPQTALWSNIHPQILLTIPNFRVGCLGRRQESSAGWPFRWTRHRVGKVLLASCRPDSIGKKALRRVRRRDFSI